MNCGDIMKKVIVIGAGASGFVSAIEARKNNNEVIILERNSKCGKKLLLTGNGKCNYTNTNQSLDNYHSNHPELLKKVINDKNINELNNFFTSIGIIPRIKNNLCYPYSNQAISIESSLELEARLLGVKIINDFLVTKITKKNNQFIINNLYKCDSLIIASGSNAYPKTGSDGFGYEIASYFNHNIVKVLPSLCPLKSKIKYNWDGIRVEAKISINDKIEVGELQLTDYGVSGICIFNLSYYVAKKLEQHEKVSLKIDFLKDIDLTENYINDRQKLLKNRNISQLFDGLLNYKLVNVILKKCNIDNKSNWDDLTKEQKNNLINNLKSFELEIIELVKDRAQICSGGVSLDELDLSSMQSLKEPNLYFTGELIDVNGNCGGYNLTWAFLSGMIAGRSIK